MFSSWSRASAITEKDRDFFTSMPTPLILREELEKSEYAPYGLTAKVFSSCARQLPPKDLLPSRISERRIKSDFSLVIP